MPIKFYANCAIQANVFIENPPTTVKFHANNALTANIFFENAVLAAPNTIRLYANGMLHASWLIEDPVTSGTNVVPSEYPLELVSPRAANTSPSAESGTPNISTSHRIFKAYPGIEYNIRAVVIGGSYPYTFSLTNEPSGMTIDDITGEITWTNPTANASPTIYVTDAEGTTISSQWDINVTTTGWRFVDSINGNDSWDGTTPSFVSGSTGPWQTLSKVRTSGGTNFIYFRGGTYSTSGMYTSDLIQQTVDNTTYTSTSTSWEVGGGDTTSISGRVGIFTSGASNGRTFMVTAASVNGGTGKMRVTALQSAGSLVGPPETGDVYSIMTDWRRTEFGYATQPVVWITYPNETANIDNNFVAYTSDVGGFVRLSGTNQSGSGASLYIDGFTFINGFHIGIQVGSTGHYTHFRKLTFLADAVKNTIDGGNSSGIMTLSAYGTPGYYGCYQDLVFDGIRPGGLKLYSHYKCLMEDWNHVAYSGPDPKADVARFEVRGIYMKNLSGTVASYAGLFGNFNGNALSKHASGEIRYNLIDCSNITNGEALVLTPDAADNRTITGASSTNPITITCSNHHLVDGESGIFSSMPGSFAALNGNVYPITRLSSSQFTIPVDGSGFSSYTSGGAVKDFVTCGEFHVYRNTLIGRFRVFMDDSGWGPVTAKYNTIINNDSGSTDRVILDAGTDTNQVILLDNLSGSTSDSIVDVNGDLQGSYRAMYLGVRGHEIVR